MPSHDTARRSASCLAPLYKRCSYEPDAVCKTTGELWCPRLLVLCEAAELVLSGPAHALPGSSRPQERSPAVLFPPSPAIANTAQAMPATIERQNHDASSPRVQGAMATAGTFSGLQVSPASRAPFNPVWANSPLCLTPDAAQTASHLSPLGQAAARCSLGGACSFDFSCATDLTAMLTQQQQGNQQHGSSGGSDSTSMPGQSLLPFSLLDTDAWQMASPAPLADFALLSPFGQLQRAAQAPAPKPARKRGHKRPRTDGDNDVRKRVRHTPAVPADQKAPTFNVLNTMGQVMRHAAGWAQSSSSSGFPESIARTSLGNNPDVSKALRRLVREEYLLRSGQGGRSTPFQYHINLQKPWDRCARWFQDQPRANGEVHAQYGQAEGVMQAMPASAPMAL